jgi:hypothetical protein
VTVKNETGHRFPTGEESPTVEVRFVGLGADGAEVSSASVPITRIVEGPPFKDITDNTLLEAEAREVHAELPDAARVTHVRVDAVYVRYANTPHLAEVAKAAGTEKSVVVATLEGA